VVGERRDGKFHPNVGVSLSSSKPYQKRKMIFEKRRRDYTKTCHSQ